MTANPQWIHHHQLIDQLKVANERIAELEAELEDWRETAGRWRRDNDVLVIQVAKLEAERDDEIARRVALEQDRSDWRERATRLRAALSEIADDYLSDGDDLQEIANAALAGEEKPDV
jgi:hypothetical protein